MENELKNVRTVKGISQEKLAQKLSVSQKLLVLGKLVVLLRKPSQNATN